MKAVLKKVYTGIPFKKHIFLFLRNFWKPSESVYRHLHFTGVITIPVGKQSFKMKHYGYLVENDLFWAGVKGAWEPHSLDTWIRFVSQSRMIFDIGANTGVYSLVAKTLNRDATVYAFEPVERVYEKLVENNNLNHFNIHCIQKALSDFTGTAIIYDNNAEHEYAATLNQNSAEQGLVQAGTVSTITLDEFIEQNQITPIDLMKIDVEHYEPQVLNGFKKYLQEFRPTMLIEILTEETGAKVYEMVKGLDYLFFNVNEQHGLKQTEKIGKSEGFNYLICTHEAAHKASISQPQP